MNNNTSTSNQQVSAGPELVNALHQQQQQQQQIEMIEQLQHQQMQNTQLQRSAISVPHNGGVAGGPSESMSQSNMASLFVNGQAQVQPQTQQQHAQVQLGGDTAATTAAQIEQQMQILQQQAQLNLLNQQQQKFSLNNGIVSQGQCMQGPDIRTREFEENQQKLQQALASQKQQQEAEMLANQLKQQQNIINNSNAINAPSPYLLQNNQQKDNVGMEGQMNTTTQQMNHGQQYDVGNGRVMQQQMLNQANQGNKFNTKGNFQYNCLPDQQQQQIQEALQMQHQQQLIEIQNQQREIAFNHIPNDMPAPLEPANPFKRDNKLRYSKLERLLAQPDIFDTLRKIGNGMIKSYDDLDINALEKQDLLRKKAMAAINQRKRGIILGKFDKKAIEEFEKQEQDDDFEILKIEKQPQTLVGGTLRDYQLEGLNWLFKLYQANLNGILADEMGLGKTIQSISIIALIESFRTKQETAERFSHHIIIVPKVTLGKWYKELNEWAPSIRVFQFYGSGADRDIQRKSLREQQFDVILTTFETCMREKNELMRYQFEYLILDEAQRIKNDQSVLSQNLRQFKTRNRILLTGTPLQNNLKELWSLLNFLMPKLFESSEDFNDLFVLDESKKDDSNSQEKIIKQIHRLLKPFMLRRLKVDVEHDLPSKKEIFMFLGLTQLQKQLYKKIISGNIETVNGMGSKDRIQLLNVLMQLKKVCNHPYLFDKVEPGPPFVDGDHIIDASMKFKVLDHLIPRLIGENSKILIFSQMTRLLDILDDFLRIRGYKYCRIDGQTSAADRDSRIEDFQNPNSEKQIFILSTRAGGIGINLHQANIVIIFDSDWNPQVDLQAIDRAHRIGQKRDVIVYRFVTEGTVEEKIVERAARKLKVDHLIMQRGKFNHNENQKVNQDEMLNMIQHGAQQIILTCDQEDQDMKDHIDEIISESLKKTEKIQEQLKSIEDKFNLNNVSLTGNDDNHKTSIYSMDGEVVSRKQIQDAKNKQRVFIDIGSRKKHNRNYNINENFKHALNGTAVPGGNHAATSGAGSHSQQKKKFKGWKAQVGGGFDHQFFNNQKLDELEKKENDWIQYENNPDEWVKSGKEIPIEYTMKDQLMKDNLLKKGFPTWNKRDFFKFINMCELYGRDNLELFSDLLMTGKTLEEIDLYSKVFWKNYHRIENSKKYIDRIEKGEAEIEKRNSIDQAIEDKFKQLIDLFKKRYPSKNLNEFTFQDIEICYDAQAQALAEQDKQENSPFEYLPEEDKIYALGMFKYTYGFWEMVRNEIRNSPYFTFNWVALSRSVFDIQKRCDYLVTLFKKELYGHDDTQPKNTALTTDRGDETVNHGKKSQGKQHKSKTANNNDSEENGKKAKEKDSEDFDDIDDMEGDADGDQVQSDEEESYNPTGNKKKKGKEASATNGTGVNKRGRKPKKRGRKPKDRSKEGTAPAQPKVGTKRTKKQMAIICIDTNEKDPKENEGDDGSIEERSNSQCKDIKMQEKASVSIDPNDKSLNSKGYKIQKTDQKSQDSLIQNEGGQAEPLTSRKGRTRKSSRQ